ncbi:hypothetical protein IQ06DRAFT_304136 [Phaeosphaeriaceae sp. SRC1lsM3a]|nr:hypothetical protein IQ06DRAFT_304136 [Stagonospora sp. SRC1lsM3a]
MLDGSASPGDAPGRESIAQLSRCGTAHDVTFTQRLPPALFAHGTVGACGRPIPSQILPNSRSACLHGQLGMRHHWPRGKGFISGNRNSAYNTGTGHALGAKSSAGPANNHGNGQQIVEKQRTQLLTSLTLVVAGDDL